MHTPFSKRCAVALLGGCPRVRLRVWVEISPPRVARLPQPVASRHSHPPGVRTGQAEWRRGFMGWPGRGSVTVTRGVRARTGNSSSSWDYPPLTSRLDQLWTLVLDMPLGLEVKTDYGALVRLSPSIFQGMRRILHSTASRTRIAVPLELRHKVS